MDLLEKLLDRARSWPQVKRNEAAEILLALEDIGDAPVDVDDDTLAAIDEALAHAERGEIADPREIEAFFARFRS